MPSMVNQYNDRWVCPPPALWVSGVYVHECCGTYLVHIPKTSLKLTLRRKQRDQHDLEKKSLTSRGVPACQCLLSNCSFFTPPGSEAFVRSLRRQQLRRTVPHLLRQLPMLVLVLPLHELDLDAQGKHLRRDLRVLGRRRRPCSRRRRRRRRRCSRLRRWQRRCSRRRWQCRCCRCSWRRRRRRRRRWWHRGRGRRSYWSRGVLEYTT